MGKLSLKESLENDQRPCHGSVIAITGPKALIHEMEKDLKADGNKKGFEKVYVFDLPDNYGEFPSNVGYVVDNYYDIESDQEDDALDSHMKKCLGAVVEFNDIRMKFLDKMGFTKIEGFLHGNMEGEKVYALVGFVRAWPPSISIVPAVSIN